MARVDVPLSRLRFGETQRKDAWWLVPLVVFTVFSSFIVYATWAAFQGDHYTHGPYLSPLYSPLLFSPDGSETLTALKWSGTSVTVDSLAAAITVRVIAGGAGVVCATAEAPSDIAPSDSDSIGLHPWNETQIISVTVRLP